MSFTEEISQVNSKRGASPATPAAGAAEASAATSKAEPVAAGAAQDGLEIPATITVEPGLPTGSKPVDPSQPVVIQEPTLKPGEEKPEPKVAPIKIAGKEFTSIDEAIAYAEQLEIASREDKAFKEGYEKGKPAEPVAAAPKQPDFVEEAEKLMFEDPKKAIQLIVEGTEKRIFDAYNKLTAEQVQQAEIQKARQETWTDFYKTNSDLADSQEYIQFVMQKNWKQLENLPVDKAMGEIASLARKGLRMTRQAGLPQQELSSKAAVMAGTSGNATSANPEATTSIPVDFITQLNKLRKRK